jgi:hypothetical protein
MTTIFTQYRHLLAAPALLLFAWPLTAIAQSSRRTHGSESTHIATATADAPDMLPPAGSPEFGILIIIGVVAVFVLVAWLFARVGGDGPEASDGSIV